MLKKVSSPFELYATSPVELNMLTMKNKLMLALISLVREKGWTQKQMALELGVSQPRVSNLMNGQTSKFAVDTLLEMLCKIGFAIDVSFRDHDKENPVRLEVKKAVV